jgi:hypothetical protein
MSISVQESDVIWMAGVIDSLARFNINNSRHQSRIKMRFTVTDRPELEKELGRILQGSSYGGPIRDRYRKGCVDHCPTQHIHIRQRFSRMFEIGGLPVYITLWNCYPFIRLVKPEVESVMDHFRQHYSYHGPASGPQRKAWNRFKEMGWEFPDDLDAPWVFEEIA